MDLFKFYNQIFGTENMLLINKNLKIKIFKLFSLITKKWKKFIKLNHVKILMKNGIPLRKKKD